MIYLPQTKMKILNVKTSVLAIQVKLRRTPLNVTVIQKDDDDDDIESARDWCEITVFGFSFSV